MTSRSKERVAAAFRRLFHRSSDKNDKDGNTSHEKSTGSPSRRLLRNYRVDPTAAPVPINVDHPASLPSSPAINLSVSKKTQSRSVEREPPASQTSAANRTVRARRLMKEFKDMQKSQSSKPDPVFTAELINDNLYEWHVRLHQIDPESELAMDMKELGIQNVLLHLTFPDNFPFAPPFMRVISPRIEKGFVMEGGAICMELLTPRGWASAYTVEAILMQFAASLVKGQGRIARKIKGTKEFNQRSAEESFRSLVKTHDKYGWVTPSLSDG